MKLGTQTGSLVNHLMSYDKNMPEVGKGATELLWSDRHAYQVTWVSDDKKKCTIRRCDAQRIDNNGMDESQEYDYSKLLDYDINLIFRYGSWYSYAKVVEFIDEKIYDTTTFEERQQYYNEDFELKLIDGVTKEKIVYTKINIKFGFQREYYDYSF